MKRVGLRCEVLLAGLVFSAVPAQRIVERPAYAETAAIDSTAVVVPSIPEQDGSLAAITRPTPPESIPVSQNLSITQQVPIPSQQPAPGLDPTQLQSPDPNRDRLIQPAPIPTPASPEQTQPVLPTPTTPETPPETPPDQPQVSIPVQRIEVTGSTVFNQADFAPITRPLEGRSATLEQLREAADAITQLYLNRGFITSRAILVDQTITNGIVRIQVVEGSLERIEIEGNQRVRESYIRSRIRLAAKPPVSREKLEDQLRLLKLDPLFTNVEASLRPGSRLGQSVLVVRVSEVANPISGYVGIDNYSPPAVGSVRFGGLVSYRNLTGFGDELSASYFRTTADGANVFDFNYRIPINAMNGTLQFRYAPNDNKVITPGFSELGIEGKSQLYEVSYRQPIIRTPRQEFALSVGFTAQNGQTFLFSNFPFAFTVGPDIEGNSRTRVFKFGQDYVKRDPQGAWALRSQFNFGVDIWDATVNESPVPDGRFVSWLGQVQRVQRFGANHLVIGQFDLQLTPDSLLPSQQFVIGGGQSLRGYRQNARSGDNGFRFSIEDRIALSRNEAGVPVFQLAPFIDLGSVWNRSGNPNQLPNQRFLFGAGLGALWEPIPRLNIRVDYAYPFIDLSDRGNDAQDEGFYFSVNYLF